MNRIRTYFLAAIVLVAACAAPPPPAVVPQGDLRFLIDPRIGWTAPIPPAAGRAFESAWRYILAGDFAAARQHLDDLRAKHPGFAPADLADAAIAIREKRFDEARAIVDRVAAGDPQYTAANVYEAEIDLAQNQLRSAYERYRTLAAQPKAPDVIKERLADVQVRLFEQTYAAALTARDADAVRLLREALQIDPAASAARVLLVQKLVALRQYDDARREIAPLLNSNDVDRPEVQASLAEIEVGQGRYQQAINRYERLTKRDPEGRYARRLAEIKDQFAEANMPPQYARALEAESITRADLAVLMYWKITAIRFAQNVPAPPIATDIGEVPGRDELIRAIALGIFPVDSITRRVNPFSPVTAAGLARNAARILAGRGAPCARGVGSDPIRILAACGIDDPTLAGEDMPVSGRTAAAVLERVDRALR